MIAEDLDPRSPAPRVPPMWEVHPAFKPSESVCTTRWRPDLKERFLLAIGRRIHVHLRCDTANPNMALEIEEP